MPNPVFEENYAIALIVGLAIAFAVAISVYIKRLGHLRT
jgi:hypothetical protein